MPAAKRPGKKTVAKKGPGKDGTPKKAAKNSGPRKPVARMAASQTVTIQGILDDINAMIPVIDNSSAPQLQKDRAKMLLDGITQVIKAFCYEGSEQNLGSMEFAPA